MARRERGQRIASAVPDPPPIALYFSLLRISSTIFFVSPVSDA